uniref:Short chain dehydrogenase/reductase family 16C member 5 n=1 Tax=Aquila chrysaetos chrysaetos TaxID=223781 RepID=A0A663E230_AQUCH
KEIAVSLFLVKEWCLLLITGSANGIGSQIALNFASLGATLVLWDMDDEVFAYHCDCSNREEVYEKADKVRYSFCGDVTILINNAGILLGKKFCDILDADFEKTLRVNFLSQVWTCKAFLPAMMTCNRGHLVSTTSAAGLLGVYNYAGSNYAIIGMMETLDSEMYHAGKQGIKTTIICPYFINTELAKNRKEDTNNDNNNNNKMTIIIIKELEYTNQVMRNAIAHHSLSNAQLVPKQQSRPPPGELSQFIY